MRTAVFGGTFDPVHRGHLHLINSLANLTDYERLLVIPVAQPPHKQHEAQVSNDDRLAMLALALEEYEGLYPQSRSVNIQVEALEIERGGVSYMFDTVSELYGRYSIDGQIGMVLGDDLLAGLRRWYRFDELRHKVEFIIIRRTLLAPPQVLPPGVRGRFLDNPIMEDSSTAVRELIAAGRATKKNLLPLVTDRVADYLLDHGLYTS
ncbi:MAG: nicotinate (nicotinamide) nucleotide adenylyltransferase [Sphaerochaetaceae bacterium]